MADLELAGADLNSTAQALQDGYAVVSDAVDDAFEGDDEENPLKELGKFVLGFVLRWLIVKIYVWNNNLEDTVNVCSLLGFDGLEELIEEFPMPDCSVVDLGDLPAPWYDLFYSFLLHFFIPAKYSQAMG